MHHVKIVYVSRETFFYSVSRETVQIKMKVGIYYESERTIKSD